MQISYFLAKPDFKLIAIRRALRSKSMVVLVLLFAYLIDSPCNSLPTGIARNRDQTAQNFGKFEPLMQFVSVGNHIPPRLHSDRRPQSNEGFPFP